MSFPPVPLNSLFPFPLPIPLLTPVTQAIKTAGQRQLRDPHGSRTYSMAYSGQYPLSPNIHIKILQIDLYIFLIEL